MKKALLVLMALVLLNATCWAQGMTPKGQETTITGKLSCTFCNLATPSKQCTKECCMDCIKAGDPPLLTDGQGNLYILLSGEQMKPLMTPERMNLLETQVKVTGIVVKRGGLEGIYVKKMEKAQ